MQIDTVLNNSVLLDFGGWTRITVVRKKCTCCHKLVSYRENVDAIYNFDDHLLITHRLIKFFTSCILQSIPLGPIIEAIKSVDPCIVPSTTQKVKDGAYSCLALQKEEILSYCCPKCGPDPLILIFDGNSKVAFNLKAPDIEVLKAYNGEINLVDFWNKVREDIVKRAYALNASLRNPSLANWAPFIGRLSRGDIGYNTEFKKLNKIQDILDAGSFDISNISEEKLMFYANDPSVRKKDLMDLCESIGARPPPQSSKQDILRELRKRVIENSESMSSQTIRKFFSKIPGASGGVMIAICPHAIVYGFKILLRAEGNSSIVVFLLYRCARCCRLNSLLSSSSSCYNL